MALKVEEVSASHSFSGNVATLTLSMRIVDDALLDGAGNPKILTEWTITESQHIKADDALGKLDAKVKAAVDAKIGEVVANLQGVKALFGTWDPDEIKTNLAQSYVSYAQNMLDTLMGV